MILADIHREVSISCQDCVSFEWSSGSKTSCSDENEASESFESRELSELLDESREENVVVLVSTERMLEVKVEHESTSSNEE